MSLNDYHFDLPPELIAQEPAPDRAGSRLLLVEPGRGPVRETPFADLVQFQQMIFLQDRSILESQRPIKLPLDPKMEIPTRADLTSVAYRRWLKKRGALYGAVEGGA